METWWQNIVGVVITAIITWIATRRKNRAEAAALEKQVENKVFEMYKVQLDTYQFEIDKMRYRITHYIEDADKERERYSKKITWLEETLKRMEKDNAELKKQINELKN
ncbi:MAG: hypothetical protein LBN74_02330 [Prevotella sp.]|jgi:peptidoglycan hydrolase CwlO-like protein|nr:hypothetical protein [Prevotella sp.]